jgi:hypothetical protein
MMMVVMESMKRKSASRLIFLQGSGLTFKGLFAGGNENACGGNAYDASDYMKIFYSIDGAPEVEALCFNNDEECNGAADTTNEPLHHDPNCDGDGGEGQMLMNDFSEFSFAIPDGNSLALRIETHMDSGNEEIAYDHLRIEAQTVTPSCIAEAGTVPGSTQTICQGETLTIDVMGNQTDPAYTQVFLLVDDFTGEVYDIQSGPDLVFNTPGEINITSYNYLTGGGSDTNPSNATTIDCSNNCCDVQFSSFFVTVEASAMGSITAPADLCIDAGVQMGLGGGTPTGGVYSGPGVTDDGNGMTYTFDPAAAGVGMHTITYTPAGNCVIAASDEVEVFALPSVTFTAPADIDMSMRVSRSGLVGGNPVGGVYSGPGITDDGNGMTYSPLIRHGCRNWDVDTITYTYTDANGCTASASDDIEVISGCSAEAGTVPGSTQTICQGETITIDVMGNQTDPAYTQVFLLVDDFTGEVYDIQSGPDLVFNTPADINITSYNYLTGGGSDTNPSNALTIDCMNNCCDVQVASFFVTVEASTPWAALPLLPICVLMPVFRRA